MFHFLSYNWKSNTSKDYICITSHFIDVDWKLQKRTILFNELLPPYDGVSIVNIVVTCFSNWNVESKVMDITLDNASYNDNLSNFLFLSNCRSSATQLSRERVLRTRMSSSLRMRLLVHGRLLCDGAFLFQV